MSSIEHEFRGASLNDRRRSQRLVMVGTALASQPEKSLPKASATPAALRATYRLVNSDAVTPDAILGPHRAQTVSRAKEAGEVLVLHDTTELEFAGEEHREGLGFLRGDDQGFLLHAALVVSAARHHRPLGLVASRTWTRTERKGQRRSSATTADVNSEGRRWVEQINEAEERLEGLGVIHVADREVDSFANLQVWLRDERRFVIRGRHDRVVLDEHDDFDGYASEAISAAPWLIEIAVPISRRRGQTIPKAKGARDERLARLRVSSATLRFKWPNYIPSARRSPVEVNVVHAVEIDVGSGTDPISWVLYTSEPVSTAQQVLRVLDFYRARWLIEEFFKALKTGCAIEKRQLESYDALANILAIFLPIAWQVLTLRSIHRATPDATAMTVLSATQIEVLRAKLPKLVPQEPNVDDVLRAVAYLGGHYIKKPPGWLVLCRGMEDLLLLEAGWILARAPAPRSDQ